MAGSMHLVESELRQAIAVAQIDEGHAAKVASALDPAAKGDGLSRMRKAQFAACVCTVHGREMKCKGKKAGGAT
jgi:hypothetical protein